MIGDGPLRRQIEQEVCRQDMQERFTLPGWITPDQVIDWLRQGDILFMPSRAEGLSVVGLQALSMGLAIVSSSVGGFVDLVEPGSNGFLIPDPDSQEFSPALRTLLSDPARLQSFREASRLKAADFSLARIVAGYSQTISQIVDHG
jgi:glycosyltransferase involved in cell wall biosynthesis